MEYTTLAKLKTFLSIDGTAEDVVLTDLITQATALVDIELGDNMGKRTITRRVNGNGEKRIIMENIINSVESVTDMINGDILTVDYIEGRIVYLTTTTIRGRKNIQIVYEKGYDEVPPSMERFFLHYCRELYTMASSSETEIVKTQSLGGGLSLTYFSPSELKDRMVDFDNVIGKYKNFSI